MEKAIELALAGRYEEALGICKKIKSKNIRNAVYFNTVGIIYRRMGLLDEARRHSKRAIQIDQNLVAAKMNLANIELEKGNINKAVTLFTEITTEAPRYQEAKANLALALRNIGNVEGSLNTYKKIDFRGSWSLKAVFNYSITLIASERFVEGWKNYEYRWSIFPMNKVTWPFQDKVVWKGEKGKNIAMWREQGIGDDIIFLSLVQEVKEMCKTLSVYVDPRLEPLCRRAMPGINFVKDKEELKNVDCDYHMPLGSVPGLLRNDMRDFDRTVKGYLKADPKRVEAIRHELNLEGKTAIGISWKSFKTKYKTKSIQLRDMERLFSGLDVVLVNLQYGDVEDEIREFKDATGIEVVQCASVDNREDLDGLAALIEVCDLVVSITNVTVHLAGALAKDTWVLLHYVSIYFWLVERTDSIWYPSLTLYRQPKLDDWDSVYASIRKDLQRRLTIT